MKRVLLCSICSKVGQRISNEDSDHIELYCKQDKGERVLDELYTCPVFGCLRSFWAPDEKDLD